MKGKPYVFIIEISKHIILSKNKRIVHILRDIYAPCYLRKIVVHEAYIPYRFVDGVTENANIPIPE